MGTRADFYVGRGEQAEWLGSIAWNGYPEGIPEEVKGAPTEAVFREAVEKMIQERDDGTHPREGWPWPWEDSQTTDYAYAFETDTVYASCFGSGWWKAAAEEPDYAKLDRKAAIFPNMKDRQNVTLGKRSGVIIVSG